MRRWWFKFNSIEHVFPFYSNLDKLQQKCCDVIWGTRQSWKAIWPNGVFQFANSTTFNSVCVCVLNCCSLFKIENLALSQLKTPFLPSFHRSNLRFDNQSTCVVPSRKGTLFDGNRQHICHFGDVPVTAMLRSPSGREETCFISCLNMFYLVKNNICFSEEYVENSCRHWKQGERPFCSWIILWIALPESRYKNDDKNWLLRISHDRNMLRKNMYTIHKT